MSGWAKNSAALSAVTLPPYWIRVAWATSCAEQRLDLDADESASLVGVLGAWPRGPVPIAQTGS